MKMRKIPLRVCVGCQEQKPKKELLRIVRTPEDTVEIDKTGKNRVEACMSVPTRHVLKKRIKNIGWNGL